MSNIHCSIVFPLTVFYVVILRNFSVNFTDIFYSVEHAKKAGPTSISRPSSCFTSVMFSSKTSTLLKEVISSISLAVLLGLTWLIGYLLLVTHDPDVHTVLSIIFCVFNTTQVCARYHTVLWWIFVSLEWTGALKKCCPPCSTGHSDFPPDSRLGKDQHCTTLHAHSDCLYRSAFQEVQRQGSARQGAPWGLQEDGDRVHLQLPHLASFLRLAQRDRNIGVIKTVIFTFGISTRVWSGFNAFLCSATGFGSQTEQHGAVTWPSPSYKSTSFPWGSASPQGDTTATVTKFLLDTSWISGNTGARRAQSASWSEPCWYKNNLRLLIPP